MTINTENTLFDIEWTKCPDGYEIVHCEGEIEIIPKSQKRFVYHPYLSKGLARKFADLSNDGGEIIEKNKLEFANRYGLLGISLALDGRENLRVWANLCKWFRVIYYLNDSGGLKDLAQETFNNAQKETRPIYRPYIEKNLKHPSRSKLKIRPANLGTLLWIMLADEITAGIKLKKCEADKCGEWFHDRGNKKCCSNACKQATFRSKKNRSKRKLQKD